MSRAGQNTPSSARTALPRQVEAVLDGRAPRSAWLLTIGCGVVYGLVMGCHGARLLQAVYSGLKVPLLFVATVALTLPSFFILNTLRGLRDDFGQVVRAVIAAQAAVTIVLVSFAPVTAFWYASFRGYHEAILFNALIFGVSSVAGQVPLRKAYRPLIERDRRHALMVPVWLVLYAFVGIQMGWVLRPFVGSPSTPVEFLRSGAWENAYVVVARMIWGVLSGG